MELTCEVAPAVIFYSVYECGTAAEDAASAQVDTAAAGAKVVIADGTQNTVNGSYVARIYKPGTVELNEDGTQVEDAKKLHKYDGAFYSKMSMNLYGEEQGTGVLNINAANEGLDSELHLTVYGGVINILSGNDGINTNEDGVSVTTVNGGELNIRVTGETGEGDGIDSNGWLVINGGTVTAQGCATSGDAGIDSDMGIQLNDGTVIATGNMLDQIAQSGQNYAVFRFAQAQPGGQTLRLQNAAGDAVLEFDGQNGYSILVFTAAALTEGEYTLWSGDTQLAAAAAGTGGNDRPGGMMRPQNGDEAFEGGKRPDGMELPDGAENGNAPAFGGDAPDDFELPDGMMSGGMPGGGQQPDRGGETAERTTVFKVVNGGNTFSGVAAAE